MENEAASLAGSLAAAAEATCRQYLSNGRRSGNYWLVGDVRNAPGKSMYVRLVPTGDKLAGKWVDAATGEHGDLLDVIREACGLSCFREVTEEARRFLALPQQELTDQTAARARYTPTAGDAPKRLFATTLPAHRTLVETYLASRGLSLLQGDAAIRFHPSCYVRPDGESPKTSHPAMIAAVTDFQGTLTGIHRTWLQTGSAASTPKVLDRRAMGKLLGNGVRFGKPDDVWAIGEGIETTLSLREAMPGMPLLAALSAGHLGAVCFPTTLRRLYVARDGDAAGDHAFERLRKRTADAGIQCIGLIPQRKDFNDDLRELSATQFRELLQIQLEYADVARFISVD